MAKPKNDKNQKPQDSFADDLDSMLNLDDVAGQEVGLIDDDEAIDRLLIGDDFEAESLEENASSQFDDIDQLIDEGAEKADKIVPDFDEFGDDIDDLIADIQIPPKQSKEMEQDPLAPPDDLFIEQEAEDTALDTPGTVENLAQEDIIPAEIASETDIAGNGDVLEAMTEIDEFSDEMDQSSSGNADFLLADFDISVDDEFADDNDYSPENPVDELSEPEPVAQPEETPVAEPEAETINEELVAAKESLLDAVDADAISDAAEAEIAEPDVSEMSADNLKPAPVPSKPDVEYAALIAGLTAQINDLVKQQAHVNHDLQLKGDKDELKSIAGNVDTLQSEQKKTKRHINELNNKKPVSAYVANGIAVVALIVGGSLGYQGYVAKSQVAQIIDYMGKMQTQINAAPTADAAEKEMLRKQLDELSRANSVTSEQIAELTKSMQGQAGGDKPTGELSKQLADLNNQDMQMGAAIEALQGKVAALEKGRATKPAAKPVAKKPPVAEDNWVVNLVAFKQDWYAKRKAEEFAGKGVQAKVVKTESKGETWYRLSVDGFKSQYEAAAYAARVKKTLNLDSVWVNKNKK
ncbi:SPOR domain-containing protein [Methylomonas methanica]|uniref:Sporulation domain-containing protein n=1 Tax=Methylomonas methanica (strain DSM 25384 / MC09) TaxID=857087 RepID=F9ZX75_METMM|nr:SPOR domain-containing protein [Methylomonas methanica]AEF99685.1 Sporulation domain-containing protein [Methylomonas methanica MC09]